MVEKVWSQKCKAATHIVSIVGRRERDAGTQIIFSLLLVWDPKSRMVLSLFRVDLPS